MSAFDPKRTSEPSGVKYNLGASAPWRQISMVRLRKRCNWQKTCRVGAVRYQRNEKMHSSGEKRSGKETVKIG
jgi:hypothetical protein